MATSPINPAPSPANYASPFAIPKIYDRSKVAPWWHTILFVAMMVGYGFFEIHHPLPTSGHASSRARASLYLVSICFEFALLGYVWLLGLKLEHKKLRDIIGGDWSKFENVAIDFGIAVGFWIVAISVLVTTQKLLHVDTSSISRLRAIMPQNWRDLALFTALACSAGFCEETVFRGYLQRQMLAATGNRWVAAMLQAILFGWVHIYQGWKQAIVIGIYGALFGLLAVIRGNLRPGILQHAGQDSLAGAVFYLLTKFNVPIK